MNNQVVQNEQRIVACFKEVCLTLAKNPNLQGYQQQVADSIYQNNFQELMTVLHNSFSSAPWNDQEAVGIINSYVNGVAGILMQGYNINIPNFYNDIAYVNSIHKAMQVQQPMVQQQPYQQPIQVQQQPMQPMSAAGIQQTQLPTTLGEINMTIQAENHIPKIEADMYQFKTQEAKEPVIPVVGHKQRDNFTPKQLIDRIGEEYNSGIYDEAVGVYVACAESFSKTVSVTIKENLYLPVVAPSEELVDSLMSLSSLDALGEFQEEMLELSNKYPLTNFLALIDSILTNTIIDAATYRYGISGFSLGSFQEDGAEVLAYLNDKGFLEDIEDLLVWVLKDITSDIKLTDYGVDSNEHNFILESIRTHTLLSIPWPSRYDRTNSSIWVNGCTEAQLGDLIDQTFNSIEPTALSIIVADAGNVKYKIFRKGFKTDTPGTYVKFRI